MHHKTSSVQAALLKTVVTLFSSSQLKNSAADPLCKPYHCLHHANLTMQTYLYIYRHIWLTIPMHFLRTPHILTFFRESIAAGRADLFQHAEWKTFFYEFRTAQVIREHQMQTCILASIFKQYYCCSTVVLNISTS